MSDSKTSNSAWDAIENEKKRDRFIRRVSVVAWSVTGLLVLLLAVLVGSQAIFFARAAMSAPSPGGAWRSRHALVIALGC
jgi:hypothetical protein